MKRRKRKGKREGREKVEFSHRTTLAEVKDRERERRSYRG